MCLNCGCGELDERHGNSANLIRADLQRAADANGQTLEETAGNVIQGAQRMTEDAGDAGAGART